MAIVEKNEVSPRATVPDPATWLDHHGNALYAYALMRVRDASVAEDLVQDTLLAAIKSVDGFKGKSSWRLDQRLIRRTSLRSRRGSRRAL